jgi:outer membrane lipoprotein carrier protein
MKTILLVVLLFVSAAQSIVHGADEVVLQRLAAISTDLKTFTADFEQTLYDADSNPMKTSSGTVVLMRPGRFIWRYEEPEVQEIIADGKRIWLYDEDLQQVTVTDIDERIAGTPLVLLMGTVPLEDEFTLATLGESDGIEWVELTPKSDSSDFEAVFIGLNDEGLAAMELRDNFGQATQIRFSDFKADVSVDASQFDFKPPPGVDVIGQDGS